MDSGNDKRNSRGIYRTKVRVPRQTIYSRKQRKQKLATSEVATSDSRNHSKSQCSENTAVLPKPLAEDSASQSIDSFSNEENAILMLDESSQCACIPTDQNSAMTSDQNRDAASTMLYEGSQLSTENSLLLLNSYMCRHHLTRQAREDLLELVRLHLPKKNKLPSSLYLFQKTSDQIDAVVPNYHHYCPECYTLLQDSTTTLCSNECCKTTINFESSPYFITVSIANQLNTMLSRMYNYNYICAAT